MEAWNIRMTFWHMRFARKKGDGNISAGMRRALERWALEDGDWIDPAPPMGAGSDEPLR